ncbi:MAG: class A beta-lactamase-related serine hydrolase [Saprospiraceae bacterium]|nr:class A beta-lactamase-related serine hydrolase [Saprospiraceae bacterium]
MLFSLLAWTTGRSIPTNKAHKASTAFEFTDETLNNLPLEVPDSLLCPLDELADAELQNQLNRILKSDPKWVALANAKKLSIGLVDMRDPLKARFAGINKKEMVYAASLPKIAVLLTSIQAIENGELEETSEVTRDMRLMIAKSNNAATTRMIDRVGMNKIAEVMQDPRYHLYDRTDKGGLWVGKAYGRGGARKGDPLKNISHAATAEQVCRYYYMLANGQLVSPERSRQMLDIMGDPELHHKFVNVLDRIAPDAKVFRKSGSWKNWHADSVLVWGKNRKYILVGLAETPEGEQLMRDLIKRVDRVLMASRNA